MTGLPVGSLVFQAGDHTCIVLATGELECFCPCTTGDCGVAETVTVTETEYVTVTQYVTVTVPVSGTIPVELPEDDGGEVGIPPTRPNDDTDPNEGGDTDPEEGEEPNEDPEQDPEKDPEEGEDPSEDPEEGEDPKEGDDDKEPKPKCNQGVGNGTSSLAKQLNMV